MSSQLQTETIFEQAAKGSSNQKYNNFLLNEAGIAGYLGLQCLLYPLERLKVLQQVDLMPEVRDEQGRYLIRENIQSYIDRHNESNTFESFYRGFGTKLVKLVTKELSIYMVADRIRERIQVFNPHTDPFKYASYNLISAALSGLLVETIVYPLELAKTRLICDGAAYEDRVYQSIFSAMMKDANNGSESRIFQGALFSLGGAALYRGTQIGIYETLLQFGLRDYSQLIQLPVSILVTLFAQRLTYPLDTLRRQLMLQNTAFEITSADLQTIVKRMSHPARGKDLLRGWSMQYYKSITTAIKESFNQVPGLISKLSH